MEDDDFLPLGNSLYNDDAPKKIKKNSAMNSINVIRNRAKITNLKVGVIYYLYSCFDIMPSGVQSSNTEFKRS